MGAGQKVGERNGLMVEAMAVKNKPKMCQCNALWHSPLEELKCQDLSRIFTRHHLAWSVLIQVAPVNRNPPFLCLTKALAIITLVIGWTKMEISEIDYQVRFRVALYLGSYILILVHGLCLHL